jgi:hypothetical protein
LVEYFIISFVFDDRKFFLMFQPCSVPSGKVPLAEIVPKNERVYAAWFGYKLLNKLSRPGTARGVTYVYFGHITFAAPAGTPPGPWAV